MGDVGSVHSHLCQEGLSHWLEKNRFAHTDFSIRELAVIVREKHVKITVLIPAKEVAATIGDIIKKAVRPLVDAGVVREVIVIDAASEDGTAKVAKEAGAQVLQRIDIATELGPSKGKGDALWRGLLSTGGDIVAFLDGDTEDPVPAHLVGILGPLIMFDNIQMVRACFDRPFKAQNGCVSPHDGGRVTELLARPVLNRHWPELAGFRQPLAGEFSARRSLLEKLHFPVGYGVEIGTLIDAYRLVGLNALAEVDIGQRQNVHKHLRDLTIMAGTILGTAERRVGREKPGTERMFIPWLNDYQNIDTIERPPIQIYRTGQGKYPSPPFVIVEGVRMFRDIGGSPVSGLRKGLIFRSGDPSTMTQLGIARLIELGIERIYDLRSPIEFEGHHSVHGTSHQCTLASETSPIYPDRIRDFGIERVIVPVFADEEWHQDRRDSRLRQYACATEVDTRLA
ncbi:uncharacterized protein N7443_004086 [Penicillium atrosanguineum]|uniref:uncharacterized protein n=1 Tax=Penicillium atrosanguineum TaxID=1132637 RepID=UPI0023A29AA4|nr:uncharacterized protein N7443_004086 [Penicillium atrosanguineum]KAJ5304426.1 hypothetical protein N7443_004086 [Penicillium atrosanguineum]